MACCEKLVITEDGYIWGEEGAGHTFQSAVVITGSLRSVGAVLVRVWPGVKKQ